MQIPNPPLISSLGRATTSKKGSIHLVKRGYIWFHLIQKRGKVRGGRKPRESDREEREEREEREKSKRDERER